MSTIKTPIVIIATLEQLDRTICEANDEPRRWTVTFTRELIARHPSIAMELSRIRIYRGIPVHFPEQPAGHEDAPAMIRINLRGDHVEASRYIMAYAYTDTFRLPLYMYTDDES